MDAHVSLVLTLPEPIELKKLQTLQCTFAGGFAPVCVAVLAEVGTAPSWTELESVYPRDGNQPQAFPLATDKKTETVSRLMLRLDGSTDGFGRIVVYELNILD